jgi:hypothetical protein
MRFPLLASALVLVLTFLAPSAIHAQDSALVRTASYGVSFGISSYTFQTNEVPVHPTHGTSFEGGLNWLFPIGRQSFIKLGMEFTDYRSPFAHDTSYYDFWFQLPVLFRIGDLARFGPHSRLVLSGGPRFSFLIQQGVAGINDENYHMRSSLFRGLQNRTCGGDRRIRPHEVGASAELRYPHLGGHPWMGRTSWLR